MYRSIRDQSVTVTGVYPIAIFEGGQPQPFRPSPPPISVLPPPPSMLLPMLTTVDPHRSGDRQDISVYYSPDQGKQSKASKQGKVLPKSLSLRRPPEPIILSTNVMSNHY